MSVRKCCFLLSIFSICMFVSVTPGIAQGGGKAMPERIEFEKGKSGKTVTGSLSNNEEQEYILTAREGQKLQIWISSRPRGKYHSFSILGVEGVDYTTDYDSNYSLTTILPDSGDYLITVKKRPTKKQRSAKYYLTVKITI